MIVIAIPVDVHKAINFVNAHRYQADLDIRGEDSGFVAVYHYNNIHSFNGETINSIEGAFCNMIELNSHIDNVRVIKIKVGFSILIEQTKDNLTEVYEAVEGRYDLFVRYSLAHTNFDKIRNLPTTLIIGQHQERIEEYINYMNMYVGDVMNYEGYAGRKKYIGVGVSFHVFRLRNTVQRFINIDKLIKNQDIFLSQWK
jgi:hypothetical protein